MRARSNPVFARFSRIMSQKQENTLLIGYKEAYWIMELAGAEEFKDRNCDFKGGI